jgi:peptide chain release factor 2/peptide chain release factor
MSAPELDLIITSGVGPAEARRFVFRLAARLEQLAAASGFEVREVTSHGGHDGAPRSIAIRLCGGAPELLAGETGTHLLVHRSASRSRSSRKRWFAAVELRAAPADDAAAATPAALSAIPRDELVITACRAGGPGGQHVNKVSSAVRVHHLPSGIIVRSAAARSQKSNLDRALRRLAALLHLRATDRRAAELADRRAAHYRLERGRPVRTYHLDARDLLVEEEPPP